MEIVNKKNIAWAIMIVAAVIAIGFFLFNIGPVNANAGGNATMVFAIDPGDGFRAVGQHLYVAHLIRSPFTFDLFSLIGGRALEFKPGLYKLSPSMDAAQIVAALAGGDAGKVTVTIPEGSNIYDIDRILSVALVIRPSAFAGAPLAQNLEGHLFPDTYQFYTNDTVEDVVNTMMDDFNVKTTPLFSAAPKTATTSAARENKTLIIASLLEKEVPDQKDQEVVAGIILKRLAIGMRLNIDATVCYAKFRANPAAADQACSLSALDFKIDSPYNTYLYKGLPPAPIGNPGISAITAALHPESSPYLYYLSDPATGKTIFAKTLDEQNQNRVKYLESN